MTAQMNASLGKNRLRSATCITLGVLAGSLVLSHARPASTALPPLETEVRTSDTLPVSDLVLRAQKALSKLGLYLGDEDGRLTKKTRSAIKIYQRLNGLEEDGQATLNTVGKLEYAVGVRKLMRQLERARAESINDARSKLLSHPATRDLIKSDGPGVADPTRDPSLCFEQPTAFCLLNEALESAKAVVKTELRDWAHGEILIAEARAGLGHRAMETAALIKDPRLVIVALRDISEAQAAAGHAEDALAAAGIIPDPSKKSAALAAIAEIQLRRNDLADAKQTADKLIESLFDIEEPLKEIAHRTRAAVILAQAGAREHAERELELAERTARTLQQSSSRSAGMRHVASALADMEETARALDMLASVSSPADRTPVLMTAAEAQARAGDAVAALATASSIESVRYRAVALGRIALAQAASGNVDDADTTLQTALAAVDRIERPYAQSFAISRIAIALTQIHDISALTNVDADGRLQAVRKAIDIAEKINDRKLKAHTLWLITAQQRAIGDEEWVSTEAMAEAATDDVIGALSRVWMFAEISEGHAIAGNSDAAWRAFDHGIAIAKNIENAWSRSRTMAKLAATLIRLVDPGEGRDISAP